MTTIEESLERWFDTDTDLPFHLYMNMTYEQCCDALPSYEYMWHKEDFEDIS